MSTLWIVLAGLYVILTATLHLLTWEDKSIVKIVITLLWPVCLPFLVLLAIIWGLIWMIHWLREH